MKPDSFIPFYGDDFFQAVEGLEDLIVVAYLRAIWHYWSHNHCAGLRDDQEFLRRLCRVDRSDWERVASVIFDNGKFFTMGEDGLWHQKRAAQVWAESTEKYNKAVARSQLANEARWGRKRK